MADQVQVDDQRIDRRLKDAFSADQELDHSGIRVKSVSRGEVVLDGHVHTVADEARALEIARRTPGVRYVASEVLVDDRMNDLHGDNRMSWRHDRNDYRSQTGSSATDAWITTKVKLGFVADRAVPAGAINVDTWHGRVTLFGRVPSRRVRDRAERVAANVRGVRSVENQLVVVPRWERRPVAVRDDDILNAVHDKLSRADLADAHVRVHVADGVVQLSGSVRNTHDRLTAVTLARSTRGVVAVRDDLRERTESRASR